MKLWELFKKNYNKMNPNRPVNIVKTICCFQYLSICMSNISYLQFQRLNLTNTHRHNFSN